MKKIIEDVLKKHAINNKEEIVTDIISAIQGQKNNAIVIVANKGSHAYDESLFPSKTIFYASEGNIGGTPMSDDQLKADLETIIKNTAIILKEKNYQKVYIVPSGLPVVSIVLSALVFQVCSLPAIVLQYDRETGTYWPMEIANLRKLVTEANKW